MAARRTRTVGLVLAVVAGAAVGGRVLEWASDSIIHFPPSWIDAAQWLDGLWPNSAATFLGVIGAFIADRKLTDSREVRQLDRSRQKLDASLRELEQSLNHNRWHAHDLATTSADRLIFRSGFDLGTWEMTRDAIREHLDDPALAVDLALFHDGLEELNRGLALYLRQYLDHITFPSWGADTAETRKKILDALRESIVERAAVTATAADDRLRRVRERLKIPGMPALTTARPMPRV